MSPKERLLLIGNFASAWTDTSAKVCEVLAAGFEQAGHVVLTASQRRFRPGRLADMAWTTWHQRQRFDLAIIETFSTAALCWSEICAILARRAGKPVVLVLSGGALPQRYQQSPARLARHFARAQALVSPSGYLADEFSQRGYKVHVIDNPVAVQGLHPRTRTAVSAKLIWARAFDREVYNPEMAVRVVARLREKYPDLRLVMAGPDRGGLAAVKALARSLGVLQNITFAGRLPKADLLDAYNEADILLHTNRIDNMPVSVIEAQAAGLCVVGTAVGGLPWVVRHQADGLLIPSDDDQAMAAAIIDLLESPALAQRLSSQARVRAQAYQWPSVYARWQNLFRSLASHPASVVGAGLNTDG